MTLKITRSLAGRTDSPAPPLCSVSMTTPQARPSGKGICSSLMKRRLSGNANSTPNSISPISHMIICHQGITLSVMII